MTTLPLFASVEEPVAAPERELTPAQREAVERRDGPLLVHAGAGSGKTSVLVERFVRSVLEDRVAVERMLAITFTEKAAAELRRRIRARFLEAGDRERARAAETAWISTIHGFCSRLLRAHALAAGLDPEYAVLDEHAAERLGAEAFEAALDGYLAAPARRERLELAAAYGPDRLEAALRRAYAQARGRGEREHGLPRAPAPDPGALDAAHARLARAARRALEALSGEPDPGARVLAALAKLERCAALTDSLAPGARLDPFELRALGFARGAVRAFRGEAFDELELAHEACLELCLRARASADLRELDDLLRRYGAEYARRKRERSALDFDDLELGVRDLLTGRPALREAVRARFEHVLVDELQDTNPLQNEIVDLVGEGRVFAVGDELQSIYGFRGADVGVFAARRQAAAALGRDVRLAANFRSAPEILDALDAAFQPVFGPGFSPLEPPAEAVAAGGGKPSVELLVVDGDAARWDEALPPEDGPFGETMRDLQPWRAAEARLLAARIGELIEAGEFEPGEIAVLVRSRSDIDAYDRALGERGLPTHLAGGGGYWSSRQVADLRAYLAVLANPLDEEALVSVLASPLVGVSLDALSLLRLRAGRGRELWRALESALASEGGEAATATELTAELPAADRDRLTGFADLLSSERAAAPRRSLAALIERAVCATGYDRRVLAMADGERRMANVRKLERLAREFEAAQGRDLRGFLDSLAERELGADREGEAPLEGEGIDALRLMTVHAAKGLEFPLVCVADLGRCDPPDTDPLRISGDGRIGLRIPSPDDDPLDALDLPALAGEAREAARAEEHRLLWVAATRAERRLIVSGALDLERWRAPGGRPAPIEWLATALAPDLRDAVEGGRREGSSRHRWEGREPSVAWRVVDPSMVDGETAKLLLAPAADRARATAPPPEAATAAKPGAAPARGEGDPGGEQRAPAGRLTLGTSPAPPVRPAPAGGGSRISYSSLESHRRCGYRFFLERVLGLEASERDDGAPAPSEREPGPLDARTRGSVVHELLERVDLHRPAAPTDEQVAACIAARGVGASAVEVDGLRRLVQGFLASPLRERMARSAAVRRELPFAFPLATAPGGGRAPLVEGVMDAHCREGTGALVVDYKSDCLGAREDLEHLCARDYSTQRLVYALAALRGGAEWVEVAHLFLERPEEPVTVRFEAAEQTSLERRLGALVEDLLGERHEPSAAPGDELCRGCPGRASLCPWPAERTSARTPAAHPGTASTALASVRVATYCG